MIRVLKYVVDLYMDVYIHPNQYLEAVETLEKEVKYVQSLMSF